jgi:uncharacterized membrane protein YkvA (DUF1232 family)
MRHVRTALYPLLSPLIRRLPAYSKLAWRLIRDRRLTRGQRVLVLGGVAYLVSPIDLIPGFIPIVGQMDDIAVTLWTMRAALRRLPADLALEHLSATGLTHEDLDGDLARLSRSGRLLAAGGARLGWKGMVGVGRMVGRLGRRLRGR